MSDAELRRVRDDLEIMQAAAGLGLPFGWPDVWLGLALVPCGAALAAWAALGPPGLPALGLAPLLALAVVAAGRWAVQERRGPPAVRERRFESRMVLAAAVGMAVLVLWQRGLGLPSLPTRGAALFTVGVLAVPLALSSRPRRVYLAAAVGLIPFGLVAPLFPDAGVAVAGGLAAAAAGLTAAAVMALQLRVDGRGHERTAD
jgi:hypothetical protein